MQRLITYLFICISMPLLADEIQNTSTTEHIEVTLRMVGHELLLKDGDSTSLVLPISKADDLYKVSFESEFSFVPEDLVNIVNEQFKRAAVQKGYILQVQECGTMNVVYSYEVSDLDSADMIPCQGRAQPKGCYNLLFMFTDGVTPEPPSKGTNYVFFILPLLLLIAVFIVLRKPKRKEGEHVISLGQYLFDKNKAELLLKEQRVELTGKEAELLLLLYDNLNNTVERDTILNVVWGDEGDYVGRTLDVFISKLRKKLEADPNIKIMNIRGVGYKLVVD